MERYSELRPEPREWWQWAIFCTRLFFIGGKCLTMIYKDIVFAIKFKQTYKTNM